jgi:hypothetical protein
MQLVGITVKAATGAQKYHTYKVTAWECEETKLYCGRYHWEGTYFWSSVLARLSRARSGANKLPGSGFGRVFRRITSSC